MFVESTCSSSRMQSIGSASLDESESQHKAVIALTESLRPHIMAICPSERLSLWLPVTSASGELLLLYAAVTEDGHMGEVAHTPGTRPPSAYLEAFTSGQCRLVPKEGGVDLLLPVFGFDGTAALLLTCTGAMLPSTSARRSTPSPALVVSLRAAVGHSGLLEGVAAFLHSPAVLRLLLDVYADASIRVWVPDDEAHECACCEGTFNFLNRRHHCRWQLIRRVTVPRSISPTSATDPSMLLHPSHLPSPPRRDCLRVICGACSTLEPLPSSRNGAYFASTSPLTKLLQLTIDAVRKSGVRKCAPCVQHAGRRTTSREAATQLLFETWSCEEPPLHARLLQERVQGVELKGEELTQDMLLLHSADGSVASTTVPLLSPAAVLSPDTANALSLIPSPPEFYKDYSGGDCVQSSGGSRLSPLAPSSLVSTPDEGPTPSQVPIPSKLTTLSELAVSSQRGKAALEDRILHSPGITGGILANGSSSSGALSSAVGSLTTQSSPVGSDRTITYAEGPTITYAEGPSAKRSSDGDGALEGGDSDLEGRDSGLEGRDSLSGEVDLFEKPQLQPPPQRPPHLPGSFPEMSLPLLPSPDLPNSHLHERDPPPPPSAPPQIAAYSSQRPPPPARVPPPLMESVLGGAAGRVGSKLPPPLPGSTLTSAGTRPSLPPSPPYIPFVPAKEVTGMSSGESAVASVVDLTPAESCPLGKADSSHRAAGQQPENVSRQSEDTSLPISSASDEKTKSKDVVNLHKSIVEAKENKGVPRGEC